MSLLQDRKNLQLVRVMPSELNLTDNEVVSVMDGGSNITYRKYTATSTSGTTINVKMPPSSFDDVLDPVIYKKVDCTINFNVRNGTGAGRRFFDANTAQVLLRSWPLSRITSNETMHINNEQFHNNYDQRTISCLERFNNNSFDRQRYFGLAPTQPDRAFKETGADGDLDSGTLNSPVTNPQSFLGQECARGYGAWITSINNPSIPANSNGVVSIRCTIVEPIRISPLFYNDKGLTHLKNMSYNCTFSNSGRAIQIVRSVALTGTLSALSTEFVVNKFDILCKYTTPKITDKVPKVIHYDWRDDYYQESVPATVAAGSEAEFNIVSQNLSSVPSRLYLWVERPDSEKNPGNDINKYQYRDACKMAIKNISIEYGNRSALLSTADPEQLYQISKGNGLNLNYTQHIRDVGSYMCIDFGKDMGVGDTKAPSSSANPTFSIRVKAQNITDQAFKGLDYTNDELVDRSTGYNLTCVLKALIIYDGAVVDTEGDLRKYSQLFTVSDILKASTLKQYDIPDRKKYFGGVALPMAAMKAIPLIKGLRKAIQTGAPLAKKVADVAENIGLGKKKTTKKKKAGRIGGKIGGKRVKRRMLK